MLAETAQRKKGRKPLTAVEKAAQVRHRPTAPEGFDADPHEANRCQCTGPQPRQRCWLDPGPDGVCDACRKHCRPEWRADA